MRGRGSQPVWRSAEAGTVVRGTVSEIHNFGAFVRLGGNPADLPGIGFIRIPGLTWERFDDPARRGVAGQQIDEPLAPDPLLQS